MARQEIDLTTPQPNGKMGEPTKAAWEKVNDMTAEIYQSLGYVETISGKNLLINCGIPVNQRVFGGGALAAGQFGYDRWRGGGASGANMSINSSTGVWNHVSGDIVQVVESPHSAWGVPLTMSVENPTANINVSVGGATGVITQGTGRRSVTVTPTGSGHMVVQLTATGASYSRPQLERGSIASSFDYVPFGVEVERCRRYYRKSYNLTVPPGSNSNDGVFVVLLQALPAASYTSGVMIQFGTQMRANPSVLIYPKYGGASGSLTDDAANVTRQASLAALSQSGFYVFASTSSSSQINLQGHWTAEAEI